MAVNRPLTSLAVVAALPLLSGCIARTAASVVTAPVRVVSQGADWATTSQSEADRNRGRDLRKREERYGKLQRDYRRQSERCEDGDDEACDRAQAVYDEIQGLRATIPASRDYRD
jgi:hypothetical protein